MPNSEHNRNQQRRKRAVVEETGENRSRPIILDDPNTESETSREKELPNTEEAAIDPEEEGDELEEDVEIDRQERTNADRHAIVNIDRHYGNNVDRRLTPAEPAMERVYRTLPPFPPNKTQTKRELDKVICKKAFNKITLEMPLSDAIRKIPWRKYSHLVNDKHLVSTVELRNTHD
ncbi:hypothetical protein DY000_02023576 [Brassica cretica]|uniref:Uncharacterized protein n=1 Tax=Brassica cretica TaxID=69181 RepID=A0ABQ7EHJ1_BRACR|nr:hypothetical protein DY000_02023576 [Brassica cretica]